MHLHPLICISDYDKLWATGSCLGVMAFSGRSTAVDGRFIPAKRVRIEMSAIPKSPRVIGSAATTHAIVDNLVLSYNSRPVAVPFVLSMGVV